MLELAALFADLQALVVEDQQSALDNVELYIQSAVAKVDKGATDLAQADAQPRRCDPAWLFCVVAFAFLALTIVIAEFVRVSHN